MCNMTAFIKIRYRVCCGFLTFFCYGIMYIFCSRNREFRSVKMFEKYWIFKFKFKLFISQKWYIYIHSRFTVLCHFCEGEGICVGVQVFILSLKQFRQPAYWSEARGWRWRGTRTLVETRKDVNSRTLIYTCNVAQQIHPIHPLSEGFIAKKTFKRFGNRDFDILTKVFSLIP